MNDRVFADTEVLISCKDFCITYCDRGSSAPIVDSFSLTMSRGERVAIVGPSGCGKTTLLNNLFLTDRTAIFKKGLIQKTKHLTLGLVPQEPSLIPWKNVLENCLFPFLSDHIGENEEKYVNTLIRLSHMQDFVEFYPDEISGGMQSKVSIMRALSVKPDILLLDEPFSRLDEITREHLYEEYEHIWTKLNTSLFLITHSLLEAIFFADTILVTSQKPLKIKDKIEIKIPHPRALSFMQSGEFFNLLNSVRRALAR